MNEIVETKKNELLTQKDFDLIREYDEISKRYKVWKDSKIESFKNFLKENDTDDYKVTADGVTYHIYETKPYKKKQTDTKKMKEEGVYDLYTRDVWVKGSIRVQVEYEEEE